MRDLHELDGNRDLTWELKTSGGHFGDGFGGCFQFRSPVDKQPLRIMASRWNPNEQDEHNPPWDHVSVSRADRCPTWEEMEFIKRQFFAPDEVAFQLHVSESKHISIHAYCLHIWRPCQAEIPLPPSWMVG